MKNEPQTKVSCTEDKLQSLIVPLRKQNLVIPQSLLAEVVSLPDIEEMAGVGNWIRGLIDWRGKSLPLLSIEQYCGYEIDSETSRMRRVAIMRTVDGAANIIEYYAIEIQAVPHPVKLGENDIQTVEQSSQCDLIACYVQAAGVKSLLLNIEVLEHRLSEVVQGL